MSITILWCYLSLLCKVLIVHSVDKILKGAFFWDCSGIGILGIDGIRVLLGAIPFSE